MHQEVAALFCKCDFLLRRMLERAWKGSSSPRVRGDTSPRSLERPTIESVMGRFGKANLIKF